MPVLSPDSYPFQDEDGKIRIMDPATGQKYEVDPGSGGAILPGGGIDYPDWVTPDQPAAGPTPTPGPSRTSPAPSTGFITPGTYNLPPVNVQPGLGASQWAGTYNLGLAGEKRAREQMEKATIPQARANIDQFLGDMAQKRYQNQVGAREGQERSTGYIPRYIPTVPSFQPGGWKAYQEGGLVSQPGYGGQGPGPKGPLPDEATAAQAIWNNDQQMQQMYKQQHPEMDPQAAVRDWWSWSQHEGANSLAEYARMKGWA